VIAKNQARLLEQRLLDIRRQPDCEAALAKAITVTERVLAKHNRAQAEFDRIEGINFGSRMLRLLDYRRERLANGQTPD
jgi:predicted secreted Zn-dependent protease